MKKLIESAALIVLRLSMNIYYALCRLFSKKQDKVVFLSRQSSTPSLDFRLLADEIVRQSFETKIEYFCRIGRRRDMGLGYILHMMRSIRSLASARACVTESYSPTVSMLRHPKSLRIVQIWHSPTAVKQFGLQTVGREEGSPAHVARIMRMHKGYDFVTVGGEGAVDFFAEAMGTPRERILPIGMPRADVLLSADREDAKRRFLSEYPQASGKRIVLYAPTMRRGKGVDCGEFVRGFDYETGALVIRLHPLDDATEITSPLAINEKKFSSVDSIAAADVVITDYSAMCAEAALMGVPVLFYVPDLEEYKERCGLNIDPVRDYPGITAETPERLAELLSTDIDKPSNDRLRESLMGGCDGASAQKIAHLVLTGKA